MKKSLLVLTVLMLSFVGGLHAQQMNLDDVIKRAARAVEEILPQRTMVAVLNFDSPSKAFSDYVIEELTGELVTGRRVTIVDRRNLELISQEMNLQLSGDVSDESAQAIGRMLGAQSIVSGTLTNMGTFYRVRVRVINVETAAIQTQVSLDLRNDSQVAFLLSSSPAITPPVTSGEATSSVSTPTIEGTIVSGSNLTEKLAWLQRSADSHNTYILEVRSNENIAPHIFEYRGAINITIVLRGDNTNRTIRLRSNGTMFTINSHVTFILDNNITLQGHNQNNSHLVNVNGGIFRMNAGSTISGNTNTGINAGGVAVSNGSFEMNGGNIIGNTAGRGGGVRVTGGNFTFSNGSITGNTAQENGGGVALAGGSFTMTGGTISGNKAAKWGGGVICSSTFTIRGGTITGNTAGDAGGGAYIEGTFTKTGGTITGYNSDQGNGNVVRDNTGILARRGHAVFVNENRRKETTAGSGVNLSNNTAGGWD